MALTLSVSLCKTPNSIVNIINVSPPKSTFLRSCSSQFGPFIPLTRIKHYRVRRVGIMCSFVPSIDSQSIASQLFAISLFPYIGFLYFITKSNSAPKLTLFGFYFLLVFVGATIPAAIYEKVQYGNSLSNVDWLHGGAESLLTLTNFFIVIGLREGLRRAGNSSENAATSSSGFKEKKKV